MIDSGKLWQYWDYQQSILVVLTPDLIRYGAHRGVERQIDNIVHNRQQAYGHDAYNDWQTHINGALGELAVAICLNLPWDGQVGDLDALDVGEYQVRTAHPSARNELDTPRLILHPKDKMSDIFIHVVGANGRYLIRGWVWAMEGQQAKHWTDPSRTGRPAYFVPNELLRPMRQLVEGRHDELALSERTGPDPLARY